MNRGFAFGEKICRIGRSFENVAEGMNAGTILRYQFGNAEAIRAVAENRNSIFVGMFLVLLTAIARNYDQMHFSESPMWLIGPLVFSTFSGTFLFAILYACLMRNALEGPRLSLKSWLCFMGLFWMTAPIAWLYAIPVERLMGSYAATQANLALLGTVSLWRVLLMARVVSVMHEVSFRRAMVWIGMIASLETVLVIFVGGIFSGSFSRRILSAMGGMRNAPEEDLLVSALGNVMLGALGLLGLFFVIFVAAGIMSPRQTSKKFTAKALPMQVGRSVPIAALMVLASVWVAIAIVPQQEQLRFLIHEGRILKKEYRKSLDYLAARSPDDFPASRRLEPNPYEVRAWEDLPKVVKELRPDDPAWVRALYLDYVTTALGHYSIRGDALAWTEMFENIAKLPGGKEWALRNRDELRTEEKFLRLEVSGNANGSFYEPLRDAIIKLGVTPSRD